ncbi:hypothetical protein BDY21DRAFT_110011 [Lineolata rhizophorae]|uniref:Uncharacterized protein n=1 Tax=Lineolata rhizophorae TaxID=578093 RepID=A0A6A6NSG7_9PEZI|nr:hypothetical protein BDY21DRAFT_110011 [Lineolata rhizophorae]
MTWARYAARYLEDVRLVSMVQSQQPIQRHLVDNSHTHLFRKAARRKGKSRNHLLKGHLVCYRPDCWRLATVQPCNCAVAPGFKILSTGSRNGKSPPAPPSSRCPLLNSRLEVLRGTHDAKDRTAPWNSQPWVRKVEQRGKAQELTPSQDSDAAP